MPSISKGAVLGASLLAFSVSLAGCAPNKINSSAQSRNEAITGLLVINSAFGQEDFKAGLKSEFAKCGIAVTPIPIDEVHGKDKASVAALLKRRGAELGAGHLLEIHWLASSRTVGSSAGSSHYTLNLTRMADGTAIWRGDNMIYYGLLRESPQYGAIAADLVKRMRDDGAIACGGVK